MYVNNAKQLDITTIIMVDWSGGQSTPGTVASLSSHRKDLREKQMLFEGTNNSGSPTCLKTLKEADFASGGG